MPHNTGFLSIVFAALVTFGPLPKKVLACTNFLVTPGASVDGSSMVTYAADSHTLYGEIYFQPAAEHRPGEERPIYNWDTGQYLGRIPQAPKTFGYVGFMNERQVVIAETTFGGRKELQAPNGILDYGSLMFIALERATTAREAINVMTELVAEYGYASTGEVFSIADPKEVWIMAMIGKGKEEKGAVWVALRVPDGYVSAHANYPRITTFPLDDPKNCLYSPDVIAFARRKGWYDGPDEQFSFSDAYHPLTWKDLRICEARVWSFFRRVAPSVGIEWDLEKGPVKGPERKKVALPLWIKPDRKISVRGLMEAMRDHFEDTPLDLRYGVGAGPFELPYRWRPLFWKVDGTEYLNDRSTATQQTGFSFIAQVRRHLPDPIGGLLWFGVDDTATTVYVPVYVGILEVPRPYAVGTADFRHFSWDSAFWVFNAVANWAYTRYKDMAQDIRQVQDMFEGEFLAMQAQVEKEAVRRYEQSELLAREYLTAYVATQAQRVIERWKRLWEELFVKYLDGNVRNEKGEVQHPPYPEEWYRRIISEDPERYKVRRFEGEPPSED